MENIEVDKLFWKLENDNKILLTEMDENHFQLAYQTLQKRQLRHYSALEFNIKLEQGFKEVAKLRKIKLINLADSTKQTSIVRDYVKFKNIITTITTSIKKKLKQNTDAKAERPEVVL